jgi:hypothetical protein
MSIRIESAFGLAIIGDNLLGSIWLARLAKLGAGMI